MITAGVAGCLGDGSLRLTNLRRSDPQADRYVVDLLRDLGQTIRRDDETVHVDGGIRPEGFRIDAGDCPDLVPILSVLAVFAKGPSSIEGIAHLANKESDRIARTAEELRKTGMEIIARDDSLSFDPTQADWYPGWPQFPRSLQLESHNDHRLGMSFSVLGMLTGGVVVRGVECVDKSYPGFFRDARQLGPEPTLE
jgi:3-phosphoshikimate 1-carboxyvinyltransferase